MKFTRIFSAILIALMILTMFTACAQDDGTPDGYQLVVREGDEFRLYVPTQGWSPNVKGGVTGAFFSLEQNASVNVYVADDAGELDIDGYWEKSKAQLSSSLEEFSAVERSESVVFGGQPAKKFLYSAKMTMIDNGVSSSKIYKFLTVLCRYEEKMYVFVYSAPEEYYDTHIQDVEGDEDGAGIIPYFRFADAYVAEEEKKYPNDVEVPAGMKIISTDELPYRFFVPESWVVDENVDFCAASASGSDSSNVSLQMYMTDNEEMTVDEYFGSLEKRYNEIFDDYSRISTEEVELDGSNAKKYVYTFKSGGAEYKQMQVIVVKGAVFYTLTYTSTPEKFDDHIDDVNKMIETFDIR